MPSFFEERVIPHDQFAVDAFLKKAIPCPLKIVKIRGEEKLEIPEEPTWLHFSERSDGIYLLYNAWRLDPEWVDALCNAYQTRIGIRFTRQHFVLIGTVGSSPIHKDYGPEQCRINIGLQKSALAKTQFYSNELCLPQELITMQDGSSMVFNPRDTHQVQGINNEPRFLGSLVCFHDQDVVAKRMRGLGYYTQFLPNVPGQSVLEGNSLSIDHEFPNERVK